MSIYTKKLRSDRLGITKSAFCARKLLSIAIPTYNRSGLLDLCLSQIRKQIRGQEWDVELVVSDNASNDDTERIVRRHIADGLEILYQKNNSNIGADRNIAQAFDLAKGKYVLVLSDDDVLVDGSLLKILGILRSGEYGVIHLHAYPYQNDYVTEMPRRNSQTYVVYHDIADFIRRVHYNLTFISSNIVNKQLVDRALDVGEFFNTNMVQLSWTFSALFNAHKNIYVHEYLVAAKGGNTGGYKLCTVFGRNMNNVFDLFVREGVDRHYFDIINRHILFSFFPFFIRGLRLNRDSFHEESHFAALFPVFRRYLNFWVFTLPTMMLPIPMVRFWLFWIRELMKVSKYLDVLRMRMGDNRVYTFSSLGGAAQEHV